MSRFCPSSGRFFEAFAAAKYRSPSGLAASTLLPRRAAWMRRIAHRYFSGMDDGGLASFLTPIKVQGQPCHG
jgi:hypothetical protein